MKQNKAQSLNSKGVSVLLDTIIRGIQEKKGIEILSIDLREVSDNLCDYFVVCHGDSASQVRAIAEEVERLAKKELSEQVCHKEGFDNLEWVLMDFFSIVVHVFHKEKRYFYNLEELWSDGIVKEYKELT